MNKYGDIAERWEDYLTESKSRKPQCLPGNASHYPAGHPKAGQFAPAGQKGSWSIGQDPSDANKGSPGCRRGIRRKTGRGEESRAVRKPCGRLNKKSDDKKAPNLCSVKETLISSEEEEVLLVTPDRLREEVLSILGQVAENLQEEESLDEQEGQRRCPPGCSTWEQFLRSVNALKAAESGKLYQQRDSK